MMLNGTSGFRVDVPGRFFGFHGVNPGDCRGRLMVGPFRLRYTRIYVDIRMLAAIDLLGSFMYFQPDSG